jgi:hypothetical protein
VDVNVQQIDDAGALVSVVLGKGLQAATLVQSIAFSAAPADRSGTSGTSPIMHNLNYRLKHRARCVTPTSPP